MWKIISESSVSFPPKLIYYLFIFLILIFYSFILINRLQLKKKHETNVSLNSNYYIPFYHLTGKGHALKRLFDVYFCIKIMVYLNLCTFAALQSTPQRLEFSFFYISKFFLLHFQI